MSALVSTERSRPKNARLFERDPVDVASVPWDHRRALEIGAAGEHLVCADLLLSGYRAFLSSQGAPYDAVVELDGRLIRLAIKSTTAPKPRPGRPGTKGCYQFAIGRRKRDNTGKTTARAYTTNDVDIVAMVALDTRLIGYMALKSCPTMVQFEAPHATPRSMRAGHNRCLRVLGDFGFAAALADLVSKVLS